MESQLVVTKGKIETPFSLHMVMDEATLAALQTAITDISLLALDIETAHWWDKAAERLSLIQLAIPCATGIDVWIIDCFAKLELQAIQQAMINTNVRKVIHNASFDVNKLRQLANIMVENVHDTMLAARRAGEQGCSLAVLASRHLGITLDKRWQRSDWSRRPLESAQLHYAAHDAVTTLLLYYRQMEMGLNGDYAKRGRHSYYEELPQLTAFEQPLRLHSTPVKPDETAFQALLQVVTQFPGRYTPQSLAHCLGRDRSGLAGWIIDQTLGKDAFIDYQEALAMVMDLITETRIAERNRRLCLPPLPTTKN